MVSLGIGSPNYSNNIWHVAHEYTYLTVVIYPLQCLLVSEVPVLLIHYKCQSDTFDTSLNQWRSPTVLPMQSSVL